MRPPRTYHKPRVLPGNKRHAAPNERIIEISGFAIAASCTLSIIESDRGLNIRIFCIDENVSIAIENARQVARAA
jgi:hypothetical protein